MNKKYFILMLCFWCTAHGMAKSDSDDSALFTTVELKTQTITIANTPAKIFPDYEFLKRNGPSKSLTDDWLNLIKKADGAEFSSNPQEGTLETLNITYEITSELIDFPEQPI